jgi:FkbM family methyltransferase
MKIVFDIGANVGQTTDEFLEGYDKIICFEPNPNLITLLKTKFNGNSKVIIEELALSDKNEIKTFNISNADVLSTFSDDWMFNSRFTNNTYNWNTKIDVKTITLDEVIDKYGIPYFIKVDVEGYEYEVFKGLSKLLNNTYFAFEWAEEQYKIINETVRHLNYLGYNNFSYTYGDKLIPLENINWDKWENLSIHNDIDENRKDKWGMIYFKK